MFPKSLQLLFELLEELFSVLTMVIVLE